MPAAQVVDLMPAYPDADPGYHTALSLMDALDLIQDVGQQGAPIPLG